MSLAAAIPLLLQKSLGKVIDKIFPDADEAKDAKVVLTEMFINGELEELNPTSWSDQG